MEEPSGVRIARSAVDRADARAFCEAIVREFMRAAAALARLDEVGPLAHEARGPSHRAEAR